MDLKEYDRAEQLFQEAYQLLGEGGLLVSQVHQAYGLATVCEARGDSSDERKYLEEALPVLEGSLGPDYRKCVHARERLKVLSEKK